jgi:hypothetical protein
MPKYLTHYQAFLLAGAIMAPFSLRAANILSLGDNDGATAGFGLESFASNVAPGSAGTKDDDYYFAGTYPAPINTVAANEAPANFERAITNGDPNNRIHFNLSAEDISNQEFILTLDLILGGWWDPAANGGQGASGAGWGTHDIAAFFNGVQVLSSTDIRADRTVTATFSASSVNAVIGENIIELTRTGGDSKGDGSNRGWIQFDQITLESDPLAVPAIIQMFTSDVAQVSPASPAARLSWLVDIGPDIVVSIDNGVGDVTASTISGAGSANVEVRPTGTATYTLTTTNTATGESETASLEIRYENFSELWVLGTDNNSQNEFSQENGSSNSPPGSAGTKDDDYYFAGTYPVPVNVVTENEITRDPVNPGRNGTLGFERAVTNGDPNNRIHFNLDARQALPASEIRLTLDLIGGGWWDPAANGGQGASGAGWGTHDIAAFFNGMQVLSSTDIRANRTVTATFSAASVNAVVGENIIELTRTGGDSKGDGSNRGWIQFDYILAEIAEAAGNAEIFLIAGLQYDRALNQLAITFPSAPGQIFLIEISNDLKNWLEYDDNVEAEEVGNSTTVIIQLQNQVGGEAVAKKFFVRGERLTL